MNVYSDQDADAVLSADGRYRYALSRRWHPHGAATLFAVVDRGPLVVDMLNPSTADARRNDTTITRLMSYAKQIGAGGLLVVNLYGWRATDPAELREQHRLGKDVVGPDNLAAVELAYALAQHGLGYVLAAWGGNKAPDITARIADHAAIAARHGVPYRALRTTDDGHPCHPLVRRQVHPIPVPWSPP